MMPTSGPLLPSLVVRTLLYFLTPSRLIGASLSSSAAPILSKSWLVHVLIGWAPVRWDMSTMVPEARRLMRDWSRVPSGRSQAAQHPNPGAASRSRTQNQLIDIERRKRYCCQQGHLLGERGMKVLLSPTDQKRARQWLADVNEDLDLIRYPTRVQLLRAIDEAARRAESLARLDYALEHLPRL
jgi:hypothetical protein